ncbi:hypothetical protein N7444_008187 [Penicillium canescens]|nr:hypothetical protein N7444_008187 [Penicillium canescens]
MTRKTKLGVDHPHTLTSYNTQALELLRDCLAKQKQILGLNHYYTISTSQTLLEWETEMLDIGSR